jgi:transposase
MIYLGVDLHQRFCAVTAMNASGEILDERNVVNQKETLCAYLRRWSEPVRVAVEASSFSAAFLDIVQSQGAAVELVHPERVKAIASAKLKNDRVDARTLAHLLRTNLLPRAWMADAATRELRELVRLRVGLSRQITRWKNGTHAVLHRHGLRSPVSDLFGKAGRAWLKQVTLPPAARVVVEQHLALLDQIAQQRDALDHLLKEKAQSDPDARHLMSIPGIGAYRALALKAELGTIQRFASKRQLYSYAGLVPRLRQSADHMRRGGISRAGSPVLRWVMVGAALHAARYSPAARGYFERLRQRKHPHVARVALARKLLGAVHALLRDGVCFNEQEFAAMPKGLSAIP